MKYKYAFTIFTPTYNRGEQLRDIFACLTRSTFRDFEWIIVDDGSTDNTKGVVEDFIGKSFFPIHYRKQENAGKHVAQNYAVKVAEGELFLPLDSDDTIVDNALEILWNEWNEIPELHRDEFSGIGVHCIDQNGHRIGGAWPHDHMISNDLEMRFIFKIKGEKWGCIRTDIMRKYPNEEVKGNYLSESTVWFRIAKKYNKLYVDQNIRIYKKRSDSVQVRSYESDCHNAYSRICSGLIYINEFYSWYLKYDFVAALRLPLALIKSALLVEYPIFAGKDSLICKVKPIFAKTVLFFGYPVISTKQRYMIKKYQSK